MRCVVVTASYAGFFPRYYHYLSQAIRNKGHEAILLLPNSKMNHAAKGDFVYFWGSRLNWFIHFNLYQLTGMQDIFSIFETILMVLKLRKIKPDILHFNLMNVWCVNFPILIWYVNKKRIPVVWTMHDCRAFTGRCAYFDEINCNKWLSGCKNCPDNSLYNPTRLHNENIEWKIRRFFFRRFLNLTIVTPSEWLSHLVKQSFMNKYPVVVIHNGVDTDLYSKSTNLGNSLKKELNIEGKNMILGLSASWEFRKGLDYFVFLSENLPSAKYHVVLVGRIPDPENEKYSQMTLLQPTMSINEIARIYQSADVFVNPTLADNFPTTNIEALANGIPVVTFNTGGSGEAVDPTSGIVVEKGSKQDLLKAIIDVCDNLNITTESCRKRAQKFAITRYNEYVDLFESLLNHK